MVWWVLLLLFLVASVDAESTMSRPRRTHPSFIRNGLYLGGLQDAKRVAAFDVISAVDCRFSFGGKFADRKAAGKKGLERNVETLQYLAYLIHHAVHQDVEPVLVHCRQGQNRGPASLATYLMLYEGYTLAQAFQKIGTARPRSNTWNNTFILELKQIEKLVRKQRREGAWVL